MRISTSMSAFPVTAPTYSPVALSSAGVGRLTGQGYAAASPSYPFNASSALENPNGAMSASSSLTPARPWMEAPPSSNSREEGGSGLGRAAPHEQQGVNAALAPASKRYSQALPPPRQLQQGVGVPPYTYSPSLTYRPDQGHQAQPYQTTSSSATPAATTVASPSRRIAAPPPGDMSPYGPPPAIPFDHDELRGSLPRATAAADSSPPGTAAARQHVPAELPWSIHLPDQTSSLVGFEQAYLSLLGDLHGFLAAKAELEREHGQKLATLVRKTQDRLGFASAGPERRARALVVGDDPAREWDDSLVARHTFLSALRTHLHLVAQSAERHVKFADDTADQVLEGLRRAEAKKGEMVKRVKGYVQDAVEVRDRCEATREKCKARYHEACQEVEAARAKAEKHHQHHQQHQQAAAGQSAANGMSLGESTALTEMRIAKNDYVLAIRASNDAKRCLYRDALPRWSGELQDVHASTVTRVTELLAHSASIDAAAELQLARLARQAYDNYQAIEVAQDQDLFAQWNARKGWKAPVDAIWEPCPGYYADDRLECQDDGEKVHLQNRLLAASKTSHEAAKSRETNVKEIGSAKGTMYAYEKNRGLGDPDDFRDTMLATLNDLTLLEIRNEMSTSEADALTLALDGDLGPQRPHDFRSTTFTIPSDCDHCGERIWGMGKQGYTCARCKANAHVKCALRLPANCLAGHPPTDKRKSLASFGRRQSVMGTTPAANGKPPAVNSKRRSFMAGMGAGRRRSEQHQQQVPLQEVTALVSDSASISSVSVVTAAPTATHSATPPPYRQESPRQPSPPSVAAIPVKQWLAARALYDYVAADVDELSVQRGQELLLVPEAATQPGWVLVRQTRDSNGRLLPLTQTGGYLEGLVPADYIERDAKACAPRRPGQPIRALYSYQPEPSANDELELVAGKTYYLTDVGWTWGQAEGTSAVDDRGRSEWWEIVNEDGRVGVAPGNYLQVVTN